MATILDGHAVVADGVARSFGDRAVLESLDLTIGSGEFVAMLGRSGSGKSTFLRVLAGLDGDAGGRARVAERRGVVFQSPRLLPWKRVLANVELGLDGPDVRARATEALAEVGLSSHARAWPSTLSGGEAQRVALARALVRTPDLLLLDEPFGALDALTRLNMQELLNQLCNTHGCAVLLVTHDVDEALRLADRVVVLVEGRLALDRAVPHPRRAAPDDPERHALRTECLRQLGVGI